MEPRYEIGNAPMFNLDRFSDDSPSGQLRGDLTPKHEATRIAYARTSDEALWSFVVASKNML